MIACPICITIPRSDSLIAFKMKSSSITRDQELNFSLNICEHCNHYFNSSFDPEIIDYSNVEFETFYNHSEFNNSIKQTIELLLQFTPPKEVKLFDFGCGNGEFMRNFKVQAEKNKQNCEILGFEIGKFTKTQREITSNKEFFKGQIKNSAAPIVTARHVLEHLENLDAFFSCIADCNHALVYLEVPNGAEAINMCKFEDLVYEHVSYFSASSLQKACAENGWTTIANITSLGGENIGIVVAKDKHYLTRFRKSLTHGYAHFHDNLSQLIPCLADEKTVFWGVGGRCRTVLERVQQLWGQQFECVLVDSDASKCGTVVTGYDSRVLNPDAVSWNNIERIIVGSRVGYNSISNEIKSKDLSIPISHWSELLDKQ